MLKLICIATAIVITTLYHAQALITRVAWHWLM